MGIEKKIEAEIDKVKAKVQANYEKSEADMESTGLTKELRHTGSEIKKDAKIAKADLKEKVN